MKRLVGFTLALLSACVAQAQIAFSSWENKMDGWADQSAGVYSYSYSTTKGVTDGTSSLVFTANSAPDWKNIISNGDMAARTALLAATSIKLDVYPEPGAGATTANITIALNGSAKAGWTQLVTKDLVLNAQNNVEWELTAPQLQMITASADWFQIWIIAQTDGPAGSKFYVDNLRFSSAGTPPAVTANPTNQTTTVGASATFTVGNSGTAPFTYQWYLDGSPIKNSNTASFTIPCAQTTDAGSYYCIVGNGAGSSTSTSAKLTVNPTLTTNTVSVTVNATQVVRSVDDRMFGVNTAIWDSTFKGSDTLPLLQAVDMRTLRFPGGSASDVYHWNSPDAAAQSLTFDQFAAVAVPLKAHVYITANYGTGTAQEAADWVTYSNITKGYGFKYWEVGNENYGAWEGDTHAAQWDPVTYATEFKKYMEAMKAVDPTIKVGAVVQVGEDALDAKSPVHFVTNPRTGVSHKGWTPVLLANLKTLGVTPDYIIYHRYEQAPGRETDAFLLQSAKTWPDDAANLRQMLTDYLGSAGASVELSVTENNSVYGDPGKQITSLVNGLYLADSLGNLLQTEFNTMLWWDLRNGQDTTKNNSASLYGWRQYGDYGLMSAANDLYPNYYVMKLLTYFARGGDSVVKTTSNDNLLATYAAKRQDGTLSLLVINKSPVSTTQVNFALSGFSPGPIAPVYTYGVSQDRAAQTGVGHKDVTAGALDGVASNFSATFLPYSASVITLYPNSGSSRLANISLRTIAATGSQTLIAGFVTGGEGTSGSIPVLVRGIGPTLGVFGVGGAVEDTSITLHRAEGTNDIVQAANDNWGDTPGLSQLFANMGAFGLDSSSLDAALAADLSYGGNYTAQVTGKTDIPGVALAEVYDASVSPSSTTPRLINLSGRAQVGSGANILIAGFVIRGNSPKTVLIRGAGPSLDFFGVTGTLARPKLELHTQRFGIDTVIAANLAWGGTTALSNAFNAAHAFNYTSTTSTDTAVLVTLPPGNYTATVSGVNDTTGVSLVEVYEVK